MNLREAFEKLHPVPPEVEWAKEYGTYVSACPDEPNFISGWLRIAERYNALWQGFQDCFPYARDVALEDAAKEAEAAKLPAHYQWGHDAMEQFNFGKKRAAAAILAMKSKP